MQTTSSARGQSARLKIGIIGAGQIGDTRAELWAKAMSGSSPFAIKPLRGRLIE